MKIIKNKKQESIFGMSMERSQAIDILKQYAKALSSHLVKCVVYGDSLNCLDHWENEISNFLKLVNNVTTKPKNKKLKSVDYKNILFGYGDTIEDAEFILGGFKQQNLLKGEIYPDFELNRDMARCLQQTFENVKDYMLPILTANYTNVSKEEFKKLVKDAIVTYE